MMAGVNKSKIIFIFQMWLLFFILSFIISFVVAEFYNKKLFYGDTPHFFFSAIFQGFMALLGILIVAAIYLISMANKEFLAYYDKVLEKMKALRILKDWYIIIEKKKIMFVRESIVMKELEKYLKDKGFLELKKGDNLYIYNNFYIAKNRITFKNNIQKLLLINLISIVTVVIISQIFLAEFYIINNSGFWNVYSFVLMISHSILAIIYIAYTIYCIIFEKYPE